MLSDSVCASSVSALGISAPGRTVRQLASSSENDFVPTASPTSPLQSDLSRPELTSAEEQNRDRFRTDVLDGLLADRKTLPCKYLYDEAGSQLFDAICDVPEYYVTRTELAILKANMAEIVSAIGVDTAIIEPGAGSGLKTRLLLEAAAPAVYVPVDISGDYLADVASQLQEDYPALTIEPIAGDFTQSFELPPSTDGLEPVLYFPGSTIGNFVPSAATTLLQDWARVVGSGGKLLIGVDLEKDATVLEAAYDDAAGVTAAFNLNLLKRINRELRADFDLNAFKHKAIYNAVDARVEMHLVSLCDQSVHVAGKTIAFSEGESIHSENSHKYSTERFEAIANAAGWNVDQVWIDDDALFSVQLLSAR